MPFFFQRFLRYRFASQSPQILVTEIAFARSIGKRASWHDLSLKETRGVEMRCRFVIAALVLSFAIPVCASADDTPNPGDQQTTQKKKQKRKGKAKSAAPGVAAAGTATAAAGTTPADTSKPEAGTTGNAPAAQAGAAPAKEGEPKIVKTDLYTVVDGFKVDKFTMDGFRTWRSAACDRCHGANQEGLVGPSLIERLKVLTKEEFKNTVTNGRLEKGMPSFSGSERVTKYMDNLYAYLKGRSDGAIVKAKPIEMD
jgi:mono/diheme cytochrome c family protein